MFIVIDSYLSRHAISHWRTSFAGTRVGRKRNHAKTLPIQANLRDFIVMNFTSAEQQLLKTNIDDNGSLHRQDKTAAKPLADILNKLFAFSLWEAYESDLRAIRAREILEVIWQADYARQLGRQQTARELACWQGVFAALHSGTIADAEAREIAEASPLPKVSRASAQRL